MSVNCEISYVNCLPTANIGMSEFCDSAQAEFFADFANVRRISRRVQNWQSGTKVVQETHQEMR